MRAMALRALEQAFAQAVVAQSNNQPGLRNKRLRQLAVFRAYVVHRLEQGKTAKEELLACQEELTRYRGQRLDELFWGPEIGCSANLPIDYAEQAWKTRSRD